VNKSPRIFTLEEVKAQVEQAYNCQVAAVIPHSEDVLNFASGGIFAVRFPEHPITQTYRQLAELFVK
jgi:MinD-like ATPase involved in chromosome partitioning or flagellar assembly